MSVTDEFFLHVADKIKTALFICKVDSEKMYPEFYKCVSNSSKLFGLDNRNYNQLLGFELANHELDYR